MRDHRRSSQEGRSAAGALAVIAGALGLGILAAVAFADLRDATLAPQGAGLKLPGLMSTADIDILSAAPRLDLRDSDTAGVAGTPFPFGSRITTNCTVTTPGAETCALSILNRLGGTSFNSLGYIGTLLVVGDTGNTAISFLTDGTGDGEVTFPAGSVGRTELSGATIQTQRVSTGSIAAVGADVTVTWPVAFADASYTATCQVVDATAGNETGLAIERTRTKVAASVTVAIFNNNAGALTGTIDCIGIHD